MLPTAWVFVRPLPSPVTACLRPPDIPSDLQSVACSGASQSLCRYFTIQHYLHRFPETFPELSNSGSPPAELGVSLMSMMPLVFTVEKLLHQHRLAVGKASDRICEVADIGVADGGRAEGNVDLYRR